MWNILVLIANNQCRRRQKHHQHYRRSDFSIQYFHGVVIRMFFARCLCRFAVVVVIYSLILSVSFSVTLLIICVTSLNHSSGSGIFAFHTVRLNKKQQKTFHISDGENRTKTPANIRAWQFGRSRCCK